MKLLHRKTMADVLGQDPLPDHSTYVTHEHTESCLVKAPGQGEHVVITVQDGITFEHTCTSRRGGRVGIASLFNGGQPACPICGQTA